MGKERHDEVEWLFFGTGRPVFTAHGSEHALAGFMAIIDAMMSFVKDRGDSLHSIRCSINKWPTASCSWANQPFLLCGMPLCSMVAKFVLAFVSGTWPAGSLLSNSGCFCRAGKHLIVFLERGPLYLVAVSSAGEPESALKLQLDLLHAHLLAILTDNFDRMLAKNPRFEPRRLLGMHLFA